MSVAPSSIPISENWGDVRTIWELFAAARYVIRQGRGPQLVTEENGLGIWYTTLGYDRTGVLPTGDGRMSEEYLQKRIEAGKAEVWKDVRGAVARWIEEEEAFHID